MSAVSIDKFFRLWTFLKQNPYYTITDGKTVTLNQKLKDQSIVYESTSDLYQNVLNFESFKGHPSLSFPKDLPSIDVALQAREKQWKYFSKVIVPGSYAFNTREMDLFRTMTIDWVSTIRSTKDLMLRNTDAFNLDDDDVDKAIRGFGIDFVNQKSLPNTIQRQLFLLAMCDLYKIKGSPASITKALSYAYVRNAVVREYWIEREPDTYRTLRVRGVAVGKDEQFFNTATKQYQFLGNPLHYTDSFLTWQDFSQNLAEPHWYYSSKEILDIDYAMETYLKLPSLTPYFGIDFYPNIERYNILIAILEKIMSDQMNSILSGNKNLVPKDIGVGGYNQDMSERDLWITGFNQPLTLVETFLGFAYAQIRSDEYLEYTNLLTFLSTHGVVVEQPYTYPWAYQELIYWCYRHKADLVAGVIPVDAIVKKYIKGVSNYYCSTNQLVKWWLNRPLAIGETPHYWNSAIDNNVPSIFFDTAYNFQFKPDQTDTTLDEILFYNGTRKLDYKQTPFEYFQTIGDAESLLNSSISRIEFDNEFKSYHASNRVNLYIPTEFDAQIEFKNTYYDYISWIASDYYETETHDGSSIKPSYFGKYPKSVQWNWGIDAQYLYVCKSPAKWIRTIVETNWDSGEGPVDPNSPAPAGISKAEQLGYQIYYHSFIYKYVSKNTWVRYIVETDWSYCDAPISSSGHVKSTSDIAHLTFKAKIDSSVALKYITNPDILSSTLFNIVIDPLTVPTTKQFNVVKLQTYIDDNRLLLRPDGYLVKDFSNYYEKNHLYTRVDDYSTKVVDAEGKMTFTPMWTRKVFESNWFDNEDKIFVGDYKYPNLDLTDRYDAERILRGTNVLTSDELLTLPGTTNGGEILVCADPSIDHPVTWKYNGTTWVSNPVNRINDINLGVNDVLIKWIDSTATSEEDYANIANTFLGTLSNYVKIQFQDPDFDIAGIFKTITNSGLNKDIINFFKPKRARLLYFNVNLEFDDRLYNSIVLDEVISTTKILHNINDYVPRNDGIYISDTKELTSNSYYEDDLTKQMIVPLNSVYGLAVYYVSGFSDERVNGFYFNRSDLSQNGKPYYLNYHNVCLTQLINDEPIYSLTEEWVLALRKDNLHWCDALYVNYSADLLSNEWVTKDYEPIVSSSSSSPSPSQVVGKVMLASAVTLNDLRECDIDKTVDLTPYNIGKTNQWNVMKDITGTILDLPFTGDANDHSGNGYNGILHNDPALIARDGDQNTCYYFDGNNTNDQYIEVDTYPTERPIMCFSYWFKVDDATIDQEIYSTVVLYAGDGANPDSGLHWRGRAAINGNPLSRKLLCWHASYSVYPQDALQMHSIDDIESNVWYHIYEEHDRVNGVAKLYVNGILNDTQVLKTTAQGFFMEDRYIWLGRRKGVSERNFGGVIDNFKIFDRTLNETEIKVLSKIQRRPEPAKTTRSESISLRQWNPALCEDPANIRRVSPPGAQGYPETIEGERVTGYDADGRNGGINEYDYTFWAKNYPYSDDELVVKDAPKPIIGFRPSATIATDKQLQTTSDYNAPYIRYTRTVGTISVDNVGSSYSSQTIVIVEGGDGFGVIATPTISGGQITGVVVTSGGMGFTYAPTVTIFDITGSGSGALVHANLTLVSSTIPSWWNKDSSLYFSGPIFHRPVYLALQNTIHDCYPCPDVDRCCDYYDTGCRHDGPTNPQVVMWGYNSVYSSSSGSAGNQWEPGQYSDFNIKKLDYDEFTTHHRTIGFITHLDEIINPTAPVPSQITVRQYWESENSWEMNLTNPGDTYCTECDEPLFTPDNAVFTIPEEWKRCGVYHLTMTALDFEAISGYNGTWEATDALVSATSVNDFPVGYRKQLDHSLELIHVYHRDSGYYYWEMRKVAGPVLLRSELKEKLHALNEIVDENTGNWRVQQGHFLNGDDVDIAEDRWSNGAIDPSQFVGKDKSEIPQVIISGTFKTSTWIRFDVADYSKAIDSPFYQNKQGVVGEINFEELTSSTGNLYICVLSQPDVPSYLWKVSNNFEFDWSVGSESIIRPNSPNNYFGYYYRGGYIYLFINTNQYDGWVRKLATPTIPSGIEATPYFTNQWKLSDTDVYAYRYVSSADTITTLEDASICADMVPYKETYDGIRRILELVYCTCHVEDEVEISIFNYTANSAGDYIKIKTNVSGDPLREEHRFISKIYESQLPLPTTFNVSTLTSEDHYLLNKYIPFFLKDGVNKATWVRDGSDYYIRNNVIPPAPPQSTKLYSGGSYVLTGSEFSVTGSTVTYDYVHNTATIDNPSGVTAITIPSSSLNGNINITDCVNITDFTCSQCSIQELHVSGLTNLVNFSCDFNALTSLDVSGCTSLNYFTCGSNYLSSLDVSGLTNLYYFGCSSNLLTSLNVSGCSGLVFFQCHSNNLTSLDISSCGGVHYFTCSNNLLTSLSVDSILASLVAHGLVSGSATLNGTGNASPSPAGVINKNILISPRNWTVNTN